MIAECLKLDIGTWACSVGLCSLFEKPYQISNILVAAFIPDNLKTIVELKKEQFQSAKEVGY